MAGREHAPPSLITSARHGASLSTDQRTKRYLVTMGFRVACFLAAALAPTPWNIVLLGAAALLPGIAVLLANAKDNRPDAPAPAIEPAAPQRALGSGEVVPGDIEEGDEQ